MIKVAIVPPGAKPVLSRLKKRMLSTHGITAREQRSMDKTGTLIYNVSQAGASARRSAQRLCR
jgi:hypothetical protein